MAITSVAPTAASPPPPPPLPSGSGSGSAGVDNRSPRVRFANWMESTFGRAYLPITMAVGAAAGGGLGFMALGPIGGVAGAVGGALLAGSLIFAG